jgi:hypothetical protein
MILLIGLGMYLGITLLVLWGSSYFGCDSRPLRSDAHI